MICPNCGKTVPNDEMFCKSCGTAIKESKKKAFVVNIPDEEEEEIAVSAEEAENILLKVPEHTVDEESAETAEIEETPDEGGNAEAEQDEDQPEEDTAENDAERSAEAEPAADNAQDAPEKPKRTAIPKDVKENQKTYLAIKLISLFCAAVIVVLSVLSATTDIFEYDPNRPVALSGLSQEQKASFEQYASGLTVLFENGYSSSTSVLEDLLPLIQPESDNGLYAAFFEKKQLTTDKQDPAGRYAVHQTTETGETDHSYNYSVVSASDIEKIAAGLGLEAFHDANDVDYYFYDGYYYFAPSTSSSQSSKKTVVTVENSTRTQSGDYYVTCGLYPVGTVAEADGTYSEASLGSVYFLVQLERGEWTVHQVSDEPIIGSASPDDVTTGEGNEDGSDGMKSLGFEMAREQITVKTSDGKDYANYVVEYPVFETEGVTQSAINKIYTEMINSYKARTENADELYDDYIKNGGSKDDLPLYTHVCATVTYNSDGYFSLVERTAQYISEASEPEEETTESGDHTAEPTEERPQAVLMSTEYEAYTFDLDSGDFVKKDEALGKDYILTQNLLYKTYYLAKNGASDENAEQGDGNENIPEDTDGIGEAIYASAWARSKDGVLFCYKNADGAFDRVILPYNAIEGVA